MSLKKKVRLTGRKRKARTMGKQRNEFRVDRLVPEPVERKFPLRPLLIAMGVVWLLSVTPRVSADTQILRPTGAGFYTGACVLVGPADWQDVDETTPDENTTYVYAEGVVDLCGSPVQDTYQAQDFSGSATLDSVVVTIRCAKSAASGTNTAQTLIRVNAKDSLGTSNTVTTTYTDYRYKYAQKPGGGSWTVADVNALEIGAKLVASASGGNTKCTQVFATVYYAAQTSARPKGALIADEQTGVVK